MFYQDCNRTKRRKKCTQHEWQLVQGTSAPAWCGKQDSGSGNWPLFPNVPGVAESPQPGYFPPACFSCHHPYKRGGNTKPPWECTWMQWMKQMLHTAMGLELICLQNNSGTAWKPNQPQLQGQWNRHYYPIPVLGTLKILLGYGLKLQQGKFRLEVRRNFLAMRVVKHWNRYLEKLWYLHPWTFTGRVIQSWLGRSTWGWLHLD